MGNDAIFPYASSAFQIDSQSKRERDYSDYFQETYLHFQTIAFKADYISLDLETTGLHNSDRIIEIGAVFVFKGKVIGEFDQLVNPCLPLTAFITQLTGITDSALDGQPTIDVVLPVFLRLIQGKTILGHNIAFDMGFLSREAVHFGLASPRNQMIDTLEISSKIFTNAPSHTLEALLIHLGISNKEDHRACSDARNTYLAYEQMKNMKQPIELGETEIHRSEIVKSDRTSSFFRLNYLNNIDTEMQNSQPEGVVLKADGGIGVSGVEEHAKALQKYGAGAWIWVVLKKGIVPKGKNQGVPTLWAILDGETIGYMTALQGSRHLPFVKGTEAVCKAHIKEGKKHLEIRVEMPNWKSCAL